MTNEKSKPAKRPANLMDLHIRITGTDEERIAREALDAFADAVVRACDAPASDMRRRIFAAVEALRDA